MSMEQYVVSRELAKKLKEAGYPQSTEWFIRLQKPIGLTKIYWHGDMDYDNERFSGSKPEQVRFREENEFFAAPMTDELLEQLPNVIEEGKTVYYLLIQNPFTADRRAHYHTVGTKGGRLHASLNDSAIGVAKTQPEALAQLWLWLKDHGYIKTDKEKFDAN